MFKLNFRINDKFKVSDSFYEANASFDNILKLIDVFKEKGLSEQKKIVLSIKIMFGKDTNLISLPLNEQVTLLNDICDRYLSGSQEIGERDLAGNLIETDTKQYYSIEQDAEFIYAGFMQDYQINLFKEQGKLHWHLFKALLDGLSEGTKFRQVISIRQWEPSKNDSEDYIRQMTKLQRIYSLDQKDGD